MKTDATKAKKISYLLYSRRSLRVNRRSYVILFIAIICMVVMSSNIIIYNSSYSRGEDETTLMTYGSYHAAFKNVDRVMSMRLDGLSYVKSSADVRILCRVANPNTTSSVTSVALAEYTDTLGALSVSVSDGSLPSADEIMINDTVRRAFSLNIGDDITLRVRYGGYTHDKLFYVSGIYSGAEATNDYIFISEQTSAEIMAYNSFVEGYTIDKYLTYKSSYAPIIRRNIDSTIEFVNGSEQTDSDAQEQEDDGEYEDEQTAEEKRSAYMNTPVVTMKKFYQKTSFLVTALMSILPAAVAMLVFVVLDIYRGVNELSILSMIGTTPRQIFRILISKYFIIYLIAFPAGMTISAVLIKLLCVICDGMNNNEKVFLRFDINPASVVILFFLCFIILTVITFYVSRKMTAVSYTQMLSAASNANNVFVQNTASSVLKEGRRKFKLGVMFFARNRRTNLLFCIVIAALTAIFSYFSMILTQEVGNIPIAVDRGDFTLIGDAARGTDFSTIEDAAVDKLAALPNVRRVMRSYYVNDYYDGADPIARLNPSKLISKPKRTVSGAFQKSMVIKASVFAEEYDQSMLLYDQYVVSGSIENLYRTDGQIGLFVNTWQNSSAYYRVGDTIDISPAYGIDPDTGELTTVTGYYTYTIGCVLYDRVDEYENVDVVRIMCDAQTFAQITYISEPSCVNVVLEDNSDTAVAAAEEEIRALCKSECMQYTNARREFLQSQTRMISSVIFYSMLWLIIMFILVMMLTSLTGFLLRSREGTISTLYMIGAKKRDLMTMFGLEFVISGAVAAAVGAILSLLVITVYSNTVRVIYNPFVTAILALTVILSALTAVAVPYTVCRVYFGKEKYISRK